MFSIAMTFCLFAPIVIGLPEHVYKIPNGMNIPDPCKPGSLVASAGHINPNGGGARNQFGLDFEMHRVWSLLCPLDSDKDGFTNGQELGDPNCQWTIGAIPEQTHNITHPGICTPVDSPICKDRNVCQTMTFTECGSNSFSTAVLVISTLLIVFLTIAKLIINREMKYRFEHGVFPPKCCAPLPYDKPGFSWDQ